MTVGVTRLAIGGLFEISRDLGVALDISDLSIERFRTGRTPFTPTVL